MPSSRVFASVAVVTTPGTYSMEIGSGAEFRPPSYKEVEMLAAASRIEVPYTAQATGTEARQIVVAEDGETCPTAGQYVGAVWCPNVGPSGNMRHVWVL